jgi:SSS family solute:Na+ symporter
VLGSKGGFMESLKGLSAAQDANIANGTIPGIFNSFFGPDPVSLLGVVILTSLGTWGLPQMVGKFYAIRKEGDIRKGTIISTAFALIVAGGCYFLGGFGRLFSEELGAVGGGNPQGGFDNVIPTMLQSLSPFLIAVVIILVLSASMSTLSSLVLTSSSTVTLDLLKGRMIKDMDEKKQLLVMRALIVVFIAISAALAIVQANSSVAFIAQAMGVSWGAMAGAFLAPFLYGLYWKRTTKAGCWVAMLFSSVFMIIDMLANLKVLNVNLGLLQSPINAGAFCMIAGLIIVPVVSLMTNAQPKNEIEKIFSCYNRTVTVKAKDSIETEE